ncbi:hypothetical protein GOP47_0023280 [Adiantum capillus-veneris]|uniref:1,3-beta-glucan synthase n=1 Tax=Adiantum capillus-veneris TaxID=13818 RepID=A0A9D4Z7P9_ADICA|nr:hypothetical protein GOP47_0023280 [Adiantum capillus-veneris]
MAASRKKYIDNILPLTEPDESQSAKADQGELKIAQVLSTYSEVQKAINTLRSAGSALHAKLPSTYQTQISVNADLFDCLETLFKFQEDNVRNQREHVILLLANHMLRSEHELDLRIKEATKFLYNKVLENYKKWCAFLGRRHHAVIDPALEFLQLAYPCLYLLIWGEAANLRFMPECLCFIFHNVAYELNEVVLPPHTSLRIYPSAEGESHFLLGKPGNFLMTVVQPIYNAVRAEAHGSKNGTAAHSSWRNYDDMNEFFWSDHCFTQLRWPFVPESDYLKNVPEDHKDYSKIMSTAQHSRDRLSPSGESRDQLSPSGESSHLNSPSQTSSKLTNQCHTYQKQATMKRTDSRRDGEREKRKWNLVRASKKIGFKAGFVEQRSFWNIFHSFHRLWIAQFLTLQVLLTLAFSDGNRKPWISVTDRDIQFRLLYIFVTWAALRAVKALLTIVMQFTLISRNHKLLALRMVLKLLVSFAWITVFCLMLAWVHEQCVNDKGWSAEVNLLLLQFSWSVGLFLLPDILALLLLLMPWFANITERSNSKVLHVLAWWFHTRTYVGCGMHQSLIYSLSYTLFWLLIFITKILFSYFLQILPMVEPTRELFRLSHVQFAWFEFFRNHNRFVVACLWAPVILIYFMDTQIWFSIYSAIVGVAIGLFSHIGEVRNLRQFQLRFPLFASAVAFNLLEENHHLREIRNVIKRCVIRSGLGSQFGQLQPQQAPKFAQLWNSIIECFREEDLIDNEEVEWLKIWAPSRDTQHKVEHHWPCVLLSSEIVNALRQAKNCRDGDTRKLWNKISSSQYKKTAIQEAFYSLKHLLEEGIWVKEAEPEERKTLKKIIKNLETSCHDYEFLEKYKADKIEDVILHVQVLLAILLQKDAQKDAHKSRITKALLNLIDGLVRDLPKEQSHSNGGNQSGQNTTRPTHNPTTQDSETREDQLLEAIQVPDLENQDILTQLHRLTYLLKTKETIVKVPKNTEASRRLAFFSNSLFMNMPRSSSVKKMMAFSVLTPYNDEDVLYTEEQLFKKNEDEINIISYLQQIFPDEWTNRLERVQRKTKVRTPEDTKENVLIDRKWNQLERVQQKTEEDPTPEDTKENVLIDRKWASYRSQTLAPEDTKENVLIDRKWASYRSQTLARTVRGMMYYQHALELLARLGDSLTSNSAGGDEKQISIQAIQAKAVACLKFTYVIACQAYDGFSKSDHRAVEIDNLLREYPTLRIAYVAERGTGETKTYHSVLAKYDRGSNKVVSIYEIKLPGPFILGEGKPENQNQAIIFTRGEALQTIDMNQDNSFEEALKVRNLLQEFNQTKDECKKPRILGIRENVFTGSVSSLASFMSAQETSFVTLSQRVLAKLLRIRMHYGHPDMFDRLWFLTRGGVSKASKAINISEDIYAGFNCTLRGGHVTHNEYIQVRKGRDVGLTQITRFEAKISGGNGEQMLSRDVYRLGHRLDFFRMLSFYYTTVGFYFNSLLVVLAAYAFLWGRVYLGLSGIESPIVNRSFNNAALLAALDEQLVVQIGVFSSLPMIVENALEWGFTAAIWHFLIMQLQLCSVFYTFSLGTKAYYFGRTLLHGGATYRASEGSFIVRRETFVTIYCYHSRSHFIKAVELIILLLIYAKYSEISQNNKVYTLMTVSYWFLALAWLLAPFLFNPSGFDWLQTVYDYEHFQEWLWRRQGVSTRAEESWEVWWNEQQDHLNDTGFWGRITEILMSVRFFLIQYGMVYRLKIAAHNKSILVYLVSWTCVVVAIMVYIVVARAKDKYAATKHIYYRGIQCFVILFVIIVIVLLVELTEFQFADLFVSMLGFLPTGWGLLCMAAAFKFILEETPVWEVVVEVARLYELIIGLIVLAPVAVLSWLPGFQNMQARILFNQAFGRGLQISKLLSGKKATYRGSY